MAIEQTLAAIRENFRFLTLEVRRQIEETQRNLEDPTEERQRRIFERDDYIDNLKSVIENKGFGALGLEGNAPKSTIDRVRAVLTATANLERIGDFAVNIIAQQHHLQSEEILETFELSGYFREILDALDWVEDALFRGQMAQALRLCRSEVELDRRYAGDFATILDRLRAGENPEDLITVLFILRYLERIGDSLLNLGEAAIFATAGERLKITQYQALAESLSEVDLSLTDVDYEGIWETRSGARIGTINARPRDAEGPRWIVFKEGRKQKVREEKEGLERWEALMPGLPPRIYGYQEHGDMASLLLEFLQGTTLQKLLLTGEPEQLTAGVQLVFETIAKVWTSTVEPTPSRPRFVGQIRKRLADVLKIHPEFGAPPSVIGTVRAPSFLDLLERARPLDEELEAPFTVLTHGDFNIDNLIVNVDDRAVHFIDLHRSRPADYLQDVSVFMVSAFRTPTFDPALRSRLDSLALEMYRFASTWAEQRADGQFQARLALGLARSYFTSTRFELKPQLAGAMARRATYLLDSLVRHRERGAAWTDFRFPPELVQS